MSDNELTGHKEMSASEVAELTLDKDKDLELDKDFSISPVCFNDNSINRFHSLLQLEVNSTGRVIVPPRHQHPQVAFAFSAKLFINCRTETFFLTH